MKKDKLLEINPDWSVKGMHKLKVRTLMKLFHQRQDWNPSECFLLIHVIRNLKFIRWMLSQHFLMEIYRKKYI
jgi:hypothetical protein